MKSAIRTVACTIALLVAGVYAFVSLRGPNGFPAMREKQSQIRDLQEQNANLERDIRLKRERIAKLRGNRSEQELEIRRRLKLLKDKETTFIIQDQAGK